MRLYLFCILFLILTVAKGQTAKEYFKKGEAKLNPKDCKEALQCFNKAVELDSTYRKKTYYPIGVIKFQLKEYASAIQYLTDAIQANNNRSGAYFYRGEAKLAIGDKEGACKDWYEIKNEKGYSDAREEISKNCN